MAQRTFVTAREEARALVLARQHPRSAKALQALFERVKARGIPRVLSDPQVARRLKGCRHSVVGTDLRLEKTADGGTHRLGEIGIYDYDRNVLIVPIVDLRSGQVLRVEERPGHQPPITSAEIEEAKQILGAESRYKAPKNLAGLDVVALPARAAFTEEHPLYGHRCFALYFWTRGKKPRRVAEAVVDLSKRKWLADARE